jgi:transposase
MQTVQQKIISNKLGLLNLAEELQNVSKACKIMGYSRDTFYRYKELKDEGGVDALVEKTRRKPNLKNRINEVIEAQVVQMATDNPAYGQKRASNELRKVGVFLSPAGVRCIWLRHDLETFKKRLAVLEKRSAELGLVLTEAQMAALERKQDDDVAHG